MRRNTLIVAGVVAFVAVVLLLGSLYTVHQSEQALVLQLGNPVRTVEEPGLHVKVPFIQSVEYYEKRVLDFDAPSVELVLGDQKRLVVDTFTRYRIADPLKFPPQSSAASRRSGAASSRSSSRACAACSAASRCSRSSRPSATG